MNDLRLFFLWLLFSILMPYFLILLITQTLLEILTSRRNKAFDSFIQRIMNANYDPEKRKRIQKNTELRRGLNVHMEKPV